MTKTTWRSNVKKTKKEKKMIKRKETDQNKKGAPLGGTTML